VYTVIGGVGFVLGALLAAPFTVGIEDAVHGGEQDGQPVAQLDRVLVRPE